jgi:hypothetical protein
MLSQPTGSSTATSTSGRRSSDPNLTLDVPGRAARERTVKPAMNEKG